jgi:hypothetical protein
MKILTSNNLSQEDKDRALQLCSWFKSWKKQGRKPITQAELIKKLKETVQWNYTTHSFPALVNYMRMELNCCIASCNEGLYFAETIEEKKEFREYYKGLIAERLRVMQWITDDIHKDENKSQVGLFTEEKQAAIYGETINDAIKNKLGGVKIYE